MVASAGYPAFVDSSSSDRGSLRLFSPAGHLHHRAAVGAGGALALAQDGSGYVHRGTVDDLVDALEPTGAVRWVLGGGGVRALTIGPEGDAFIGRVAQPDEVVRLRASDGAAVFVHQYPGTHGNIMGLLRTPDGVAAITLGRVRFISSDGSLHADVTVPGQPTFGAFAGNADGDVFLATGSSVPSTSTGLCAPGVPQVTRVSVTGAVLWTRIPSTQACGSLHLSSLPDGGVVFATDIGRSGQRLGVLNADGSTRWDISSEADGTESLNEPPQVDTAGHVNILLRVGPRPCTNGTLQCYGKEFRQLSASTGQIVHSVSLVSGDPYHDRLGASLAGLGPDRFYLNDCLDTPCYTRILKAFQSPGTSIEYPAPPATSVPRATPGQELIPGPEPAPVPLPQMPQPTSPRPTAAYVALGDSYSSGEGVEPFFADTERSGFNTCHRSKLAYSQLLDARKLRRAAGTSNSRRFVACSGAVVQDIYKRNHDNNVNEGPQQLVVSSRTKLVTISMGGNDVDFPGILANCINGLDPVTQDPVFRAYFKGSGCRRREQARFETNLGKLDGSVRGGRRLSALYADIMSRMASGGRLLVVNYPAALGQPRRGILGGNKRCTVGRLGLKYYYDGDDVAWMARKTAQTNEVIRKEVARARSQIRAARKQTIRVVDASTAFEGHGICESNKEEERWFNPLVIDVEVADTGVPYGAAPSPYSFHPNVTGQRKLARAMNAALPKRPARS